MRRLDLETDEYEHLVTTLEGAAEELAQLEADLDWFTSLTTERLEDCLLLIKEKTKTI